MCLYIDPGTGSMLITILIGLLGSVLYFFNNLFVKLKNYSGKGGIEVQTDKFPLVFLLFLFAFFGLVPLGFAYS